MTETTGTERGAREGRAEAAPSDLAGTLSALWSLVANVEALLLDTEAELLAAACGPAGPAADGVRIRGPDRRPGRPMRQGRTSARWPPGRRRRR